MNQFVHPTAPAVKTEKLSAWFGPVQALKDVTLEVPRNEILAILGPSGCGKSTFIRCLNRLHEEVPGARMEGGIWLQGHDVLGRKVDPVKVRRHIGMVFQKPNPFPGLSILENVVAGPKLSGKYDNLNELAEQSLKSAALWKEVKDKLGKPGTSLSGGQQQRLCIARALANKPDILLMDEPTSALDPISTAKVEELVTELSKSVTILMVTHNLAQARRIAHRTAFFYSGDLAECRATRELFENPQDERTRDYVTGKTG